jgi:adenylate cyclase
MSALPLPAESKDPAAPPSMTPEEKLSGDMLLLTSGFMMCAAALWLAVYWSAQSPYSIKVPLLFQGLVAATVLLYWKTRKRVLSAVILLSLILVAPFAVQWLIGGFVVSAGVSLWALMAPIGAAVILGVQRSVAWFFAWIFMATMSGVFDFLLSGTLARFDMQAASVFFALNIVSLAVMGFSLCWYAATERRKLLARRIGHFSV